MAKWYVVQVFSNYEESVSEEIKTRLKKTGLEGRLEEVLIPSQSVSEMKRGRRVVRKHSAFPGYVLMKLDLDDAVWNLIKNTPRVNGFLGSRSGSKPVPISQREVDSLTSQFGDEAAVPVYHGSRYEIGDRVQVLEGPFANFSGEVHEVDDEKQRLTVNVIIFGRAAPVDLSFVQVEKAA